MKKISVIIPAWNAQETILFCLNSVCSQTYSEIEILVIDDGSQDQTAQLVQTRMESDKRISLYCQENQGVSAARNKGLEHAKGDLVYFCDADDWLEPDLLETLLRPLLDFSYVDLSICNYYRNGRAEKIGVRTHNHLLTQEECLIEINRTNGVGGYLWNKLFWLDTIRQFEIWFDESLFYYEDALFCCQYMQYGKWAYYRPVAKYHYQLTPDSAVEQAYSIKMDTYYEASGKIMQKLAWLHSERVEKSVQVKHITICVQLFRLMKSSRESNRERRQQLHREIRKNLPRYLLSRQAPFTCKIRAIRYSL